MIADRGCVNRRSCRAPPALAPHEGRADGRSRPAAAFLDVVLDRFITQPQAPLVLSFMFLYRLGDIMMFAMSKPLLRDIGVDTAHRGR